MTIQPPSINSMKNNSLQDINTQLANNYSTIPQNRINSRRNLGHMLNKIKKSLQKRFGSRQNNNQQRLSWSLVLEDCEDEFIFQNIFKWLDHESVLNLSMVNRHMRSICTEFQPVSFRMEWWNLTEYKKKQICEFPFAKVIRVSLEGEPMLEYMPKINFQHVQSLHMNVHYYKNVEECSKIVNFVFEESSLLLREVSLNGKQRDMNNRFTLTNVLDKVNVKGMKLDRLISNLPVDVNRFLQYEMSIDKVIIGEHFSTLIPCCASSKDQSPSSLCCSSESSSSTTSQTMYEIVKSTPVNRNNTQCYIKAFRCKVTERNLKEFCALIAMPKFQTQILEITLSPALIAPEILSTLIDLFTAHLKHVKKVAIASSIDPILLKKVFSSFRTNQNNFELVLVKKQEKPNKKL